MGTLHVSKGDLLNSSAQYIAHQCNCVSQGVAGLAKLIFDKYPWADHSSRTKRDDMGTISVHGNGANQRYVINMYAQYYPGGPKGNDSDELREKSFACCLNQIAKIDGLKSIAFPHSIGCGLAQGYWPNYLSMIEDFAINNDVEAFILNI